MKKDAYKSIRAETREMLENAEGFEVEYKENPKLVDQDTMVPFANAKGGTILVGVKEVKGLETGRMSGLIIGCDVSDRTVRGIQSRADGCFPPLNIEITTENLSTNKPILRIDVAEASVKPCSTSGGRYLTRVNSQRRPMRPTDLELLYIEQEAGKFIDRFRQATQELEEKLQYLLYRIEKILYVCTF